jgi:prepilin-type N-terminal cleavage/methylation domain-containing protein
MRTQSCRRGFSLAEIMVALVILAVIVLGLATTTVTFLHETTTDDVHVRAATAADTRLAELKGWPDYQGLSAFNETKSNFPAYGWSRATIVKRDTSAAVGCHNPPFPACPNSDITRITVTVTAPAPAVPVSRSISISAF